MASETKPVESLSPQDYFALKMRECKALADRDAIYDAHKNADDLMCATLKALGYGKGVAIFYKTPKWYA